MSDSINLIIHVAEKGALFKEIELSTTKISDEIKLSQQTISRKLIEFEQNGLIHRVASTRGIRIILTQKGIDRLKQLHLKLKNIFEEKISSFEGIVDSGLGEGAYYVSLQPYVDQFKKKLGMYPYKGTLNIKVDYTKFLQLITSQEKSIIDGFKADNRTFGPIVAYKIKVNDIDAAIIIPERTSHSRDIIEVISDTCFRKRFNLKDGDKVKINSG